MISFKYITIQEFALNYISTTNDKIRSPQVNDILCQLTCSLQLMERCEMLLDKTIRYLFKESVLMLLFVLNRQVLAA